MIRTDEVELSGRLAVVTGGSRGIGAATARRLAEAGAKVVLAARPSADLEAVARELDATWVACDVRELEQVRSLARIAERLGGPDLLINAAGGGRFGDVADLPLGAWDETLDAGLRGTFLVTQALLPG